MDPQSVNHTSRNFQLLVFCSKSLYFSGKTAHALFLTKHISNLTSDSLLRPCSPRNIFHFWTQNTLPICSENMSFLDLLLTQNMLFWTQNTLPICSKQIFICHKVGLESTKRVLLEKISGETQLTTD